MISIHSKCHLPFDILSWCFSCMQIMCDLNPLQIIIQHFFQTSISHFTQHYSKLFVLFLDLSCGMHFQQDKFLKNFSKGVFLKTILFENMIFDKIALCIMKIQLSWNYTKLFNSARKQKDLLYYLKKNGINLVFFYLEGFLTFRTFRTHYHVLGLDYIILKLFSQLIFSEENIHSKQVECFYQFWIYGPFSIVLLIEMKKTRIKKETKKNILIQQITLYGKIRKLLADNYNISLDSPVALVEICKTIEEHKCSMLYERQILWPVEEKFMNDICKNLVSLSKKKDRTNRKMISLFCDLKAMMGILQKRLDQYLEQNEQKVHKQLLREIRLLQGEILTTKIQQRKKQVQTHRIEFEVPEQINENRVSEKIETARSINNISTSISKKQSTNQLKSLRETCLISQGNTFIQSTKNSFLQENMNSLLLSSPRQRRSSKRYLKSNKKRFQDDQESKNFTQLNVEHIRVQQESSDMLSPEKDQQNFEIDIEKMPINKKRREKRRNRASNIISTLETNVPGSSVDNSHLKHLVTERQIKKSSIKKYMSKETSKQQTKKHRVRAESVLSNESCPKSKFYKRKYHFKDVKKVHRKRNQKKVEQIKENLNESQKSLLFLKSPPKEKKLNLSRKVSLLKFGEKVDKCLKRVSKFRNQNKEYGQASEELKSLKNKMLSQHQSSVLSSDALESFKKIENQNDKGIVTKQTIQKMDSLFQKIKQFQNNKNSDFFYQQEKLRVRENQIFQYHLQRMQMRSFLSFKEPFPLQKSEEILREEKLMALDRVLAFENDNQWLKDFNQNGNEIDQVSTVREYDQQI